MAKIACIAKWSSIHCHAWHHLSFHWSCPWEDCSDVFQAHTFDKSGMIVELEYTKGQKREVQPEDCLGLVLVWTCTRGPLDVLQLVFGLTLLFIWDLACALLLRPFGTIPCKSEHPLGRG
jgi:hypothetical protein